MPIRIAMWSGPRNVSTALMRAWENRPDTEVVDEPFYAAYLHRSGRQHPGRAEVLAAQPTDWQQVVAGLQQPLQSGHQVQYQKQMTHHISDDVQLGWLAGMVNCFLIREPRSMLASLLRVLPDAQLPDTGLPQQLRLFRYLRDSNESVPPVIDSADLLQDPEHFLRRICQFADVEFTPLMLQWPAGKRDSDGVWARHWYGSVEKSTGFKPWNPSTPVIADAHSAVLEKCEKLYQEIAAFKIS